MLAMIAVAILLGGCARGLEQGDYPATYSMPRSADEALWADVADALHDRGPDWFVPVDTGPQALLARLALIDSADRSIDAKYYIWHEDRTGSLLLAHLLDAADRGVRVRLLLDDVEVSRRARVWRAVDVHPNMEVRLYNPFLSRTDSAIARYLVNANQFERVNLRMHNKALIIDGTVAMIGGRNVADEYHGFGEEANFRDFDVLVGGEVMPEIEVSYDTFWNSGWAVPVATVVDDALPADTVESARGDLLARAAELGPWLAEHRPAAGRAELTALIDDAVAGSARVLVDRAEVDAPVPPQQVASEIGKAAYATRENLLLVTPYLVPTDAMRAGFAALAGRGVRMTVLTNSLATNNHLAVHAAYANHREELLEQGIELHEFRVDARDRALYEAPGFTADHFTLHAKLLMRDDRYVFVGTFNLDPRSIVRNTELGLEIDSPALVARIRDSIERDLEPQNAWRLRRGETGGLEWVAGSEIEHTDPAASGWRRFESWFLGLAPLESEL
jgi:cardiolipin synthase C